MAQPAQAGMGGFGGMAPPAQAGMGVGQPMGPAQALASVPGLQVRERASLVQDVTALLGTEVQMRNRYQVLDGIGNQHFFAIERTDCCRRQLQDSCCKDCAGWEVDVLWTPPGQYMQPFLQIRKPMQCVCCWCCRPSAQVVDVSRGVERRIGSFEDPCTCFNYNFQLKDEADGDVLLVEGGCCQPAVWCPLPCGPCAQMDFTVRDAAHGGPVAHIQKVVPSIFMYCFSPETDNYHLQFEQVGHPDWRAMLLAFTIYTDFRFFNSHKQAEQQGVDRLWGVVDN